MKNCNNCKKEYKKSEMVLIQKELFNEQKIRVCEFCANLILSLNAKDYNEHIKKRKEYIEKCKKETIITGERNSFEKKIFRVDYYYERVIKQALKISDEMDERNE